MKELLGNRSQFAIELELDQNYGGSWMYGKFCYWINSIQIGNYILGTSLRDVLITLESIVRDNGHREHLSLFQLPTDELFNRLSRALYGGYTDEYEEIANQETWVRFSVDPWVDIFNDWRVFLIDSEQESRILYKNLENHEDGIEQNVRELRLPIGTFDRVIHTAYEALSNAYQKEIQKEKG